MSEFDSWWRASKYCQVVYGDNRQVALDGWNAALQSQQDGAQGGEAVAWQSRARSDRPLGEAGWMWIDSDGYMQRPDHFDYRALYTRPAIAPQATPAAVDDARVQAVTDALNATGRIFHYDPWDVREVLEADAALAAPPAEVKP